MIQPKTPFTWQSLLPDVINAGLSIPMMKLHAASDNSEEVYRYEYARKNSGVRKERLDDPSNDDRKYSDDDKFDLEDFDSDDDYDDDYDGIIPNNLLDQIDPDGVVDRIPELLRDPKFWRDAVIVLVLASYATLDPTSPLRFINADDIDYSKFYSNV